ncbi:uncharacterized protein C8Q71DRAFT_756615 [Rhodofomes roseus]|uniref:Pentatricopeptide repeat protein n=1 Tax=Rhodofomes roseus TaxID=34475 RepID=A0ABQ8KGS0_9APHY|nr:uncharacterized protein C8Q71DRAFT_756615 [Rhodofomes roseus]KAH9837047.1 hypothetical protein C8Q71DRAFT_756615 [Rhodofomes roseus]
MLKHAVDSADPRQAWHVWRVLSDRHMLRFLGPVQTDMFSRLVVTICAKRGQYSAWSDLEKKALPEFALCAAGSGVSHGLRQCMLAHILDNNSQAVIELYERYWALLETKAPSLEMFREEDQGSAEPEHDGDSPTGSPRSPAAKFVRSDIFLATITAFAMQNSFAGALRMALQTTVRAPHKHTLPWLKLLPDELRKRVEIFVRRLDAAKLLARPSALAKQFSNLTRDQALQAIQQLYRRIMEGLTGPDRWLTVSQTQKDADKLLVVPELTWPSFITAFMRCRRTDLVQKLWDDVTRLGIRPPLPMWTALIEGYAELKAPHDALSTWNLMLNQGVKPDALAYRAVIYASYHSGEVDDALKRFENFQHELPKMSPPPEEGTVLVVYNTILHGLLFYNRDEQARALLEHMLSKGPHPDIVTYNTFLRWYARNDQLKSLAEVLQMLEPTGLKGDVYTFSIVLSALMKVRDDAAQIMLNLMHRHGVQPNTATMTSIIDHQMKTQTEVGFRSAFDLLGRMERGEIEDAKPNDVTYTAMLTAIHRSDWLGKEVIDEYRQTMWDRMKDRGIRPKRATYNLLINACLDNQDPDGVQQAMRYYRDMTRKDGFIASDTWYILLRGLVRRREWAVANELVEDMRQRGFEAPGALAELIRRVRMQASQAGERKAGPASHF